MVIKTLCSLINTKIAGEQLSQAILLPLIDEVIDEINATLNAVFPTMSDFLTDSNNGPSFNYNCFPDRYMRTVIAYGVADKFYSIDEEGIGPAKDFDKKYSEAMFLMLRDYVSQVSEQYQAPEQGFFEGDPTTDRGIWLQVTGGIE